MKEEFVLTGFLGSVARFDGPLKKALGEYVWLCHQMDRRIDKVRVERRVHEHWSTVTANGMPTIEYGVTITPVTNDFRLSVRVPRKWKLAWESDCHEWIHMFVVDSHMVEREDGNRHVRALGFQPEDFPLVSIRTELIGDKIHVW